MQASSAVYDAYREVLRLEANSTPQEWTFKANPVYRQILEHVSQEQGEGYLEVLRSSPRWSSRARAIIAETALENDSVGTPVRGDFGALGVFCSPTNLRYAAQAMAILEHWEQLGLYGVNLIEVGGGYGGLALFLRALRTLFDQRHTHTIIDLPEPGAIQVAFAEHLDFPLSVVDARNASSIDGLIATTSHWPRYFVSAYGFSELTPEWRQWYEQRVVRHCLHGYLVWNMIPVYPFTTAELEVTDEQPLTAAGNKIVMF